MFESIKRQVFKYRDAVRASPPEIYNRRLALSVLVYALGGVARGWDEGATSAITQLASFQREFKMDPVKDSQTLSNIVSFVNLGCGVGALLSYFFNDRLGRLWSLRFYQGVVVIGALISTFSYGHLGALYAGRIVAGLGIGALSVLSPMAIVEIAPTATRGLMTLCFNICMLSTQMIGIFVVYGSSLHVSPAKNLQWQMPFFVQCIVPVLCCTLSFFVNDTPRWFCIESREEEAFQALCRLRNLPPEHPELLAEFHSISGPINRELAEYGKPTLRSVVRETFTVRSNLRRVQLTVIAYILAQMSGANSVTNYLPTIFGLIGVTGSNAKIYSTGFYALTKLGCCVLASLFFVDVVGRRKSLLLGIMIQMLCHTYIGSFLKVSQEHNGKMNKPSSDAAIAAIYIHAFGWSIGLYSLPYLWGAELWPSRIRSLGGAISAGWHWLFFFAMVYATPQMLISMHQWGTFIFFAAWCLVALVYCYIMVPETSGRALEHMDGLFEHHWYEMRKHAYDQSTIPLKDPEVGSAEQHHDEIREVPDKVASDRPSHAEDTVDQDAVTPHETIGSEK